MRIWARHLRPAWEVPGWVGKPDQEAEVKQILTEAGRLASQHDWLIEELTEARRRGFRSDVELSDIAELVCDLVDGSRPDDDGLELGELRQLLNTLRLLLASAPPGVN
jgi:hypothetical protein